jgi:hypothetical protein
MSKGFISKKKNLTPEKGMRKNEKEEEEEEGGGGGGGGGGGLEDTMKKPTLFRIATVLNKIHTGYLMNQVGHVTAELISVP